MGHRWVSGVLFHVVAMHQCAWRSPLAPYCNRRPAFDAFSRRFLRCDRHVLARARAMHGLARALPPSHVLFIAIPRGGGSRADRHSSGGKGGRIGGFITAPTKHGTPHPFWGGYVSISSVLCVLFATKFVLRSWQGVTWDVYPRRVSGVKLPAPPTIHSC